MWYIKNIYLSGVTQVEGLLFYIALGAIITLAINYGISANERLQAIIVPAILFFITLASFLFGWFSSYYLAELFVILGYMLLAVLAINLLFSIWWIYQGSD